jgi:hypothetical protein
VRLSVNSMQSAGQREDMRTSGVAGRNMIEARGGCSAGLPWKAGPG